MSRASHTYRAERRNSAKAQKLLWREIPRGTTHKLSSTVFVAVPRDLGESPNAEGLQPQPTTSGERNDS